MKTCLRLLLLGVIVFGWPVGGVNAAGSLVVTPDTPTITVGQTQQFSASGVSPAIAVSGGGFHTCALLADGTVHCWGRNDYGQLGNGTSVSSPTALAVPGIATATAVSAGGYHTCALLADGRILCWGADDFGQLGNGTRTHSSTVPVEVAGITTATAVSAGAFHTCAVLADGSVRCWGWNDLGQLGNGTVLASATPTQVTGIYTASTVSAGGYHTCAVLADGSMRCWGRNDNGQLGNGTFTPSAVAAGMGAGGAVPVPTVVVGISTAVAASSGFMHTCAVLSEATVRCWGWNAYGQFGNGTAAGSAIPTEPVGLDPTSAVSASEWHTCALLSGGALRCWGSNDYGQLGNGSTTPAFTPVAVSGVTAATSITTGNIHTCALLSDGAVQCWGSNDYGQLGDGTTTQSSVPVNVVGSRVTWASSDSGVATIDTAGLATGVSPGSSTITASSWDRCGSTTLTVASL